MTAALETSTPATAPWIPAQRLETVPATAPAVTGVGSVTILARTASAVLRGGGAY